jgi:enamine deaminase RidA (YjgF/YER057c/UK114 family)
MEEPMTITRTPGNPGRSQVVEYNGMVMCVGTAPDTTQGMKGQTQQVLSKIDEYLATAGTDKSKLLNAMIYISDMDLWEEMQEAWMEWVDPNNCPTRACVQAVLANEFQVEIVATAGK